MKHFNFEFKLPTITKEDELDYLENIMFLTVVDDFKDHLQEVVNQNNHCPKNLSHKLDSVRENMNKFFINFKG